MNRDAPPGLERLQVGSKLRAKLRLVDGDEDTVGSSGINSRNEVGYLGLAL